VSSNPDRVILPPVEFVPANPPTFPEPVTKVFRTIHNSIKPSLIPAIPPTFVLPVTLLSVSMMLLTLPSVPTRANKPIPRVGAADVDVILTFRTDTGTLVFIIGLPRYEWLK
jgi:hypothetical protein